MGVKATRISSKPTDANTWNCALIYGHCVQNGKLRMKSGTSNGNDMSDEIKIVLPEVFEKTQNCKNIRQPLAAKIMKEASDFAATETELADKLTCWEEP